MRTFRCHVCLENVKRRSASKYVYCRKCHRPICKPCSVEVEVPTRYATKSRPGQTEKVQHCKFCVAEEVLST